jgi:hypothetical protein
LSSVGWDNVVGNGRVVYGIVHGAGNALLMRGGACGAELRLMGVRVCSRCTGASDVLMIFICLLLSFAYDGCLVLCYPRP